MAITSRCVSDFEGLQRLEAGWRNLVQQSGCRNVFSLPGWHLAWWSSMGARRTMAILIAEEGENVVGILPLAIYRGGVRDVGVRLLEFSGGTQADVHDLISEPDRSAEVLDALREPFEALCRRVDVVRLHNIPEGSPLLDWPAIVERGPQREREPLPFLSIKASFDEMAREWTRSHRGDVRRQIRRLEKLGELTVERITESSTAHEMLTRLLAVHTAKWGVRGGPLTERNAWLGEFFGGLIDRLWDDGGIHLSTLNLDGDTISYHLGFLHQGHFMWYKPAYVTEYENFSPGKVHIAKLLEVGCAEGWHTFDFLLGAEPYKYAWANGKRHVTTLIFHTPTLMGTVGGWSLRNMDARVVPAIRSARKVLGR